MIRRFGNKAAKDVWEKHTFKRLAQPLCIRAKSLMQIMHSTTELNDLKIKGQPPNIRLHKLKGDLKGFWSLTLDIKSPWRLIFKYNNGEFDDVKLVDYHEG